MRRLSFSFWIKFLLLLFLVAMTIIMSRGFWIGFLVILILGIVLIVTINKKRELKKTKHEPNDNKKSHDAKKDESHSHGHSHKKGLNWDTVFQIIIGLAVLCAVIWILFWIKGNFFSNSQHEKPKMVYNTVETHHITMPVSYEENHTLKRGQVDTVWVRENYEYEMLYPKSTTFLHRDPNGEWETCGSGYGYKECSRHAKFFYLSTNEIDEVKIICKFKLSREYLGNQKESVNSLVNL